MKRFPLSFFQKTGRRGGKKKGPTKVRGDSAYYRRLAELGHAKRKSRGVH